MALIITIKCLKTTIRKKNVFSMYMIIIFCIKYILYYKNAHDRTIFIFLNFIIFLKIACPKFDAAPISLPLPMIKLKYTTLQSNFTKSIQKIEEITISLRT